MTTILNFGAMAQAGTKTGATASARTSQSDGDAAQATGQTAGQTNGAGGFAALMARVMTQEPEATTTGQGKLTKLADLLGQFRAEAQDSLAETFPDGVIPDATALNDWAKSMLTKLDGMLQQAGFDFADLGQVLGPLDLSALGALDGDLLGVGGTTGLLAGDTAAAGPLARVAQAVLAGTEVQGATGDLATTLADLGEGLTDTLGEGLGEGLGDTLARFRAAMGQAGTEAETKLDPDAAVAEAVAGATGTAADATNALQAAPLPDALKILFAQAVAAPADRSLPPEVQAILAAPQPTAAPMIAAVAEVSVPAQASQPSPAQGLARNLAGQIRGVSFAEGTTKIELTPQGLGKMEIEISADEAGKLRVVLRAENPAVLNAMRSDREMLAGLLRDGGASVGEEAMSFEDFGQQGQAAQQGQQAGANSRLVLEDEAEPEIDIAPVAQPAIAADGRLNVLT